MSTSSTGTGPAAVPVPTGNAYDKYATSNRIERRLVDRFLHRLEAVLPRAAPRAVLEVGVGEGAIVGRLRARWPDAAFVGLDLPDPDLARQWDRNTFHPVFGSIDALPFADDRFDLVLAVEVLEHVERAEPALGELARVSRGQVVISVPREPIWRVANIARGRYLRHLGNTPGHLNHWSRGSFTRLVGDHLEVVSVHSPLPWTVIDAHPRR